MNTRQSISPLACLLTIIAAGAWRSGAQQSPRTAVDWMRRPADVVGQEPGGKIEEQSLDALPTSPAFAPFSVNICEFPVRQ